MSLIALALCVLIVIAALVTVDVSAVVIGRARAQTAADLAALAAVTPYPELPPPRAPANDAGGVAPAAGGAAAAATSATGASVGSGRASVDLMSLNGLGSPAERATAVAAANGGRVITCTCRPLETRIAVAVWVPLVPLGTSVQVMGYARAVLRQAVDQAQPAVA